MSPVIETFTVDPARLAFGSWCHLSNRQTGQGDISASYSADRIGVGRPVRRPFQWRGGTYVCVSTGRRHGVFTAEAYLLTPLRLFADATRSYAEVVRDGQNARRFPAGFYHGMRVKHGSDTYVLAGPPLRFVACEEAAAVTQQLALF